MALSLREAVYRQEKNIIGIPLRRSETSLQLLAQVSFLRETIAAKDAHIRTLEHEKSVWHARVATEMRIRQGDSKAAFQRERDLIAIIHKQLNEIHELQAQSAKRGWFRRKKSK